MKDRLNIYLAPDLARQLGALAARQDLSKSAVVEAAVASFLSPDGADRRDAAFTRRLDRLSRQIERLERDLGIGIETLALFIRYALSVLPPLPESHQTAARAQGRERYEHFIATLGRRLQQGKSLIRDLHEEIFPTPADFPAARTGSEDAGPRDEEAHDEEEVAAP